MSGSTDIRAIDARAPGAALAPARIRVPRDGSYLATELFVAVALERGLWWLAQDDLHGAPSTEKLAELGEPVVVRSGAGGAQYEALLALPGGVLALVDGGYGHFSVETAAADRQGAVESLAALLEALEEPLAEDTTVSIGFWTRSCAGGAVRHRSLEAPTIDEIALNYTATIERELRRLAAVEEPASGRLLLWRGPPGTGKTHALRALARCWEPWCSTHVVIDPEELLSVGPYLLDLLTYDAPGRYCLIVLEDAGELIARDARAQSGAALARLLNLADGLIGQGTNTLILITTNEPVGALHPALRRPGRCLCDIEFGPLSAREANRWLEDRGDPRRAAAPMTLAELYGTRPGDDLDPEAGKAFGFARSLATADDER